MMPYLQHLPRGSSPHRLLRFFWLCLWLRSCADTAVCLPPSGSNWPGLRLAHPNFLPCAAPEKKIRAPRNPVLSILA